MSREIQIKTTMRYFTLVRMAIIKKNKSKNKGLQCEDMEKGKLSLI
jgi:hypothetical protein